MSARAASTAIKTTFNLPDPAVEIKGGSSNSGIQLTKIVATIGPHRNKPNPCIKSSNNQFNNIHAINFGWLVGVVIVQPNRPTQTTGTKIWNLRRNNARPVVLRQESHPKHIQKSTTRTDRSNANNPRSLNQQFNTRFAQGEEDFLPRTTCTERRSLLLDPTGAKSTFHEVYRLIVAIRATRIIQDKINQQSNTILAQSEKNVLSPTKNPLQDSWREDIFLGPIGAKSTIHQWADALNRPKRRQPTIQNSACSQRGHFMRTIRNREFMSTILEKKTKSILTLPYFSGTPPRGPKSNVTNTLFFGYNTWLNGYVTWRARDLTGTWITFCLIYLMLRVAVV